MIAKITDGMKIRYFQRLIRHLGKVSPDLIITAQDNVLIFRAINEYNSALPIIEFKEEYFDEYRFNYSKSKVSFEVPTINFKYAFATAFNPTGPSFNEISLILTSESKSQNEFHFVINCIDFYDIVHNWSFDVAECANVIKAVVNMSNVSATIDCRCDIFEGIKQIFRSSDIIAFRIFQANSIKHRKSQFQLTTEALNSSDSVASILKFEINDKCKVFIDNDIFESNIQSEKDEMKLSLSLTDFLIGIDIASILSQRSLIYCISPGYPIILKAFMPNLVSFDMTIATSSEESSANESQNAEDVSIDKKVNNASEFEVTGKVEKANYQTNPIVYAPSDFEREKYLKNDW